MLIWRDEKNEPSLEEAVCPEVLAVAADSENGKGSPRRCAERVIRTYDHPRALNALYAMR